MGKTQLFMPLIIFMHFVVNIKTSGLKQSSTLPSRKIQTTPVLNLNLCALEASLIYQGLCILCLDGILTTTPNNRDANDFLKCLNTLDHFGTVKVNDGKKNLSGKTLNMVTVIRQPLVEMKNGKFEGVVIEVLDALQTKHNFSRKICLREDGMWGAHVGNGTWTGMIGQVYKREMDMGITGFSIVYERTKIIDFSMPFHQEPIAILMPAPRTGNKLTILIRPLSHEVWLAVFATIFILGPSLCALHMASLRIQEYGTSLERESVGGRQLLCDVFQFIVGSLVQEGLKSPVQRTTKFVVILWWFLTLVIANIYSGYMVSFLSAPKLHDFVDDLEGLVNQKVLKWSYREDTALGSLFKSSTSGVYQKVKLGTSPNDLVKNDQDGVDKVVSGKYAYLKEKSYLDVKLSEDFMQTNNTCRMTIAKEKFFTTGFAFILQKGSKYLELINSEISISLTTGLMQKWKDMHWPKHLECENAASFILETQSKTRKLNFDDCQGANFLLLCGLLLASIAFLGEILRYRNCGRIGSLMKRMGCYGRKRQRNHDKMNLIRNMEKYGGYKIIVIPMKEHYFEKMNNSLNIGNGEDRKNKFYDFLPC